MIYESTISEDLSDEAILKALKEEDYGRYVYVCDNDQVSSQVTIISFLIRSGIYLGSGTNSSFIKSIKSVIVSM